MTEFINTEIFFNYLGDNYYRFLFIKYIIYTSSPCQSQQY